MNRNGTGAEPIVKMFAASTETELAGHFQIRHQVFVVEQKVFPATDRDAIDDDLRTIHLVGYVNGEIAGAVRAYPLDAEGRTWQGDRLAVLPKFRIFRLGADLVGLAVATGGSKGGDIMHAHVQISNVKFFEHLGWRSVGPIEIYVGLEHQPMFINLGG